MTQGSAADRSVLGRVVRGCLDQKLVVGIVALLLAGWGIATAPFDWDTGKLPRDPVPALAIPNLGENQQIVFTEWPGRSPEDVQDQVTYPLSVELMGIPGVEEVRSNSVFGFSMIFLIFEEGIEFYWSRARILEKLNALPAGTLPDGVAPALGPDATALGQVFWYTLEGRDSQGEPAGGWDLDELRTVQDWYVRHGLLSAPGISEVASIGGHVSEYQVDVDPDALRAHGVTLTQVLRAVEDSNLDVGAGVTEINRVEYLVRGRGFIQDIADLERAVVEARGDGVPIRVRDVADVERGPRERRGAITVGGAEAVGGVAIVREGYNPLHAIQNVRDQIDELGPGMPEKAIIDWSATSRAEVSAFAEERGFRAFLSEAPGDLDHDAWTSWMDDNPRAPWTEHLGPLANWVSDPSGEAWPSWLSRSRLEIVPFYDRSGLIHETLGTLKGALIQQILVTILVVIVLLVHLRSALVISAMLPFAVLLSFIMMKLFGVDANVVALAGIAISIGTIVDMGVIVTENVYRHLREAPADEPRREVIFRGTREVSSAIITAIATTLISFLPVFTMTGAEGRMFGPLAYTKTFVLIAAIFIAVTILPAALHLLSANRPRGSMRRSLHIGLGLACAAVLTASVVQGWPVAAGAAVIALCLTLVRLAGDGAAAVGPPRVQAAARRAAGLVGGAAGLFARQPWLLSAAAAAVVGWILAGVWEPLGPEPGHAGNALFVGLVVGGILGALTAFRRAYVPLLRWSLRNKAAALSLPIALVLAGPTIWLGFDRVFGFVPAAAEGVGLSEDGLRESRPYSALRNAFPGLGREFMPPFDEGSFLWMPTLSYHGSIGEALEILRYQDLAIESVPEVAGVYGKIGRAETALDPAPVGMLESVIHYKSEYKTDDAGRRLSFAYDASSGEFLRDEDGELIPDDGGRAYRQWRDHINTPDDIWEEIVAAAEMPGVTSAPQLQPIETRLTMLQTGMRAPMGVKVRGPDLETLESVVADMERALEDVHAIRNETLSADQVVGKPYLEIAPDRDEIARHGLSMAQVQRVVSAAVGGARVTTTVEGRERYPVRVRYQRERRQDVKDMSEILVETPAGAHIPLGQIADIEYRRGPQMIRSEDTFLTAFITFGAQPGWAEVDAVEEARDHLRGLVATGELDIPEGVSYQFAGDYEQQERAARTLMVVLPVALVVIFLILFLQFRSVVTTGIVFSSIAVAWAGGFVMLHLYGQSWFADVSLLGENLRDLFNLGAVNLSVAVWVGFLALFGIAVDNGVVVTTYMDQTFSREQPASRDAIHEAVIQAGERRLRPCLLTTGTTLIALLPVLTSTGRGSDIMIPMAIPSVGGMAFVLLTLITVPVLYALARERRWIGHEDGS